MSLELKIKKNFGGFILDIDINAENEVIALLGASGCGKSMTLKCIAGIETPDEGRIVVNGVTLFDSEKKINLAPQKRHVGLLFQNYALFPNMTVEQNIITGMTGFNMSKSEKKVACAEMIRKFYLTGLEKHKPSQLSGGQQQRVALARIMVSKPSILMLDEPFSALDSFLRWELEQELMKVLEDFEGTSIIVSHNRDEVYRISDRIAVICDGKVDCFDEKERLFANPPTYQSALLTGCRNFSRAEYVDAEHVRALDWDTVFSCPTEADVKYLAVRSEFLQPVEMLGENVVRFAVDKVVENFTEIVLILRTEGKNSEYSQLTVKMKKEDWEPYRGTDAINVRFIPEELILMSR